MAVPITYKKATKSKRRSSPLYKDYKSRHLSSYQRTTRPIIARNYDFYMCAHAEIIGTLFHILTSIITDKVGLSLQGVVRRLPEPGDLAYRRTRLLDGLTSESSLELEEQAPPVEESAE